MVFHAKERVGIELHYLWSRTCVHAQFSQKGCMTRDYQFNIQNFHNYNILLYLDSNGRYNCTVNMPVIGTFSNGRACTTLMSSVS